MLALALCPLVLGMRARRSSAKLRVVDKSGSPPCAGSKAGERWKCVQAGLNSTATFCKDAEKVSGNHLVDELG